ELVRGLHRQAWLRLDEQEYALFFGVLGHGLESLHKQLQGSRPGAALLDRAARLRGDAGRAQFPRQGQTATGMIDADLAVVSIRLDPGGMPVALPDVTDRVHHERVDV